MKYLGLLISAVVVALAAAMTVLLALLFYSALYPEPICKRATQVSDFDLIRTAWNTEMAMAPRLDSNEEVARLVATHPTCCKVLHVESRSLWERLAAGAHNPAPAVVVQLSYKPSQDAAKSTARVMFDACGDIMLY